MSFTASPTSAPYGSPPPTHAEGRVTPQYQQPRKMASTGGGRAWSEEEENYLIETRQHKMPYKHIAAHLQKTELACRLHYHQLSFGTKRRRRTSSVSSNRSVGSTGSTDAAPVVQRPLPALSPPASPENTPRGVRAQSPYNPVTILPKPMAGPKPVLQPGNALRLITQDIERFEERSRINRERLARLYDAHRLHFWSSIARDYGDNVSPAVLEDVWRRGGISTTSYPPTPPNRSPCSEKTIPFPQFGSVDVPMQNNSFNPINATHNVLPPLSHAAASAPVKSSFAISSLLTEDREVRTLPAIVSR